MPDRLSLMLDSMVLAVKEGHSYDGVVSIPERGLEDITYRSGLVGLLADRLELVQEAISRVLVISRKKLPSTQPGLGDEPGQPRIRNMEGEEREPRRRGTLTAVS